MSAPDESLAAVYRGEGPRLDAMLEQRARDLATPAQEAVTAGRQAVPALVLRRQGGCWLLPLSDLVRVDEVPPIAALPFHGPPILGVGLVAGRRCLLVDLGNMVSGLPPRPRDLYGHAALLRRGAVAVVADAAEGIRWGGEPPVQAVPAMGEDGAVWLDGAWILARIEGSVP